MSDREPTGGEHRRAAERVTEDTGFEPNRTAGEVADWRERYLRLAADVENTKKRLERTYATRAEQTEERLIRDILPLVDNLERALAHAPQHERRTGLFTGVELTLRELLSTLSRYGIRPIDALGRPFDPEQHEAVAAATHPSLPPNSVMHVERPGYTYHDRLLRPARVVVVAD